MMLTIDIGNSSIVTGVYDENDQLAFIFRIATTHDKTSDEYAMLLHSFFEQKGCRFNDVTGVIIASVVPTIMHRFRRMCQDYLHLTPLIVGPGIRTGLSIHYQDPKEVGADRIANAVAAIARYGAPCIVVDIGTATTFCCIDAKHRYRGGVIAPGAAISTAALSSKASKLPKIELMKPASVVGKTTIASMESGTFYGHLAMIDGVVERIKEEQRLDNAKVIATGGLAYLYAEESRQIQHLEQELTLIGLKYIYDKNQ